jgi:glycosyltransferase involved in cell wall biosynthesis
LKISLVISTFNRGHLLRHSLARICSLTIPDEIIVVDDGGTDNTEQVCEEFGDRLPIRYIYTHNPGPTICSHARNVGVRQAHYEWIATSEPELFWISDVIAQYREAQPLHPNKVISSGKVWFAPEAYKPDPNHIPRNKKAGDYSPPQGSEAAIGWVAPYTGLWKKEWLEELGGWDEGFPGSWGWDDIDLLTRLRINGIGQYINLEIEALHQFHGLGGDKDFVNEGYFRAKSFNVCDEVDETKMTKEDLVDLVANNEQDWGQITIK